MAKPVIQGSNAMGATDQAYLIKEGLATQADFSDTDAPVGAAAIAAGVRTPPGNPKTFTEQTMTQQQRDAAIAAQNAAANANRLQSMQRNAASKRLPAQTWSPDN